jgi:AraC-like DNA-binding protein
MPDVDGGHGLIIASLRAYLDQGLRRAIPAWGLAGPPADAGFRGGTRLVLGIAGRNQMDLAQGDRQRVVTLRRGDLVCIDRHSWNRPRHTWEKTFLAIILKRDHISYYLRHAFGPGSTPAEACRSYVARPPAPATLHLAAAAEALGKQRSEALLDVCRCLVAECLREISEPAGQSQAGVWLQLGDWVDRHLHEDIDRSAVALACGVHPNHVSRLFRQHAGMGFVAWVRRRRIERACALLARGGMRVAEVAQRCGFTSAEYFATVFRRECGVSPRQWARHG